MFKNYFDYSPGDDGGHEFLPANADEIQCINLQKVGPGVELTAVTHKLQTTRTLVRWLPQNTSRILNVPGIPTRECLVKIADIVGNAPSFYFGDADPESITIYSSLRSLAQFKSLKYYGITERFLVRHGIHVTDWMWVPMEHMEIQVEQIIRDHFFKEYQHVFGRKLIYMLRQGKKLEIEALLHANV